MEIVVRATFIFAFLWFITRVTGRSTLGELSTFQLLLYVTIGATTLLTRSILTAPDMLKFRLGPHWWAGCL